MGDNNNNASKAPTHAAFAFKREGKKFGRWLEVGSGRVEKDEAGKWDLTKPVHVFLDRMPIGGFTGYVHLSPIGVTPPLPEPKPQRPGPDDGEEEDT